jgi:hypothetical protein
LDAILIGNTIKKTAETNAAAKTTAAAVIHDNYFNS